MRAHRHRGRATHHRAAQRGRARRTRAHRLRELRQEAERELPLAARLELPAREPRPEAPPPRRRHPFLDVGDHLLGRRPPEARQQRRRHQVRVLDRPRRLAVGHPHPGGAGQPQLHRLLALIVRVVEDCHRDRLRRLARLERQSVPLAAV